MQDIIVFLLLPKKWINLNSCSIPCKNSHNCQEIGTVKPVEDQHLMKEQEENYVEDEHRVPRRLLERISKIFMKRIMGIFWIENSDSLVSKLKSQRLRDIIESIDGSDTKLKQLNHEMQYNKDFHDFIYEMLQEIGYVDAHGQFLEKQ